jgi:TetR/AcrR family transcriptional regulator, regulator of autoinduction and epiphytic fitness
MAQRPEPTKENNANDPKPDGRRERTKRTRIAIVSALTDLLDEGRVEPPAAEIAERAGVALRSIGQHFSSREELLLAVTEHNAARFRQAELDVKASFEDRLTAFVKDRARALEASRAMRQAAAVVAARSPSVAEAVRRAATERRAASTRLFAAEIARSDDPAATERAIALVTSGRAWDSLRQDMGLGTTAARQQLTFTLRVLLRR